MLRNVKRADLLKYAILILLLPVFLKIADFSRFVIFRSQIHELVYGIIKYFLKSHFFITVITIIVATTFLGLIAIKIFKRRLYKEFWFLTGLITFLVQILPMITLRTVKPELFILYLVIFAFVFVFLLLKRTPYDFLKSFSYSVVILFPVFSLFITMGFISSVVRPKKTILNGGPEHSLFDEKCDRAKLLSQKEIIPVWLEEAWLYGGVSTRDGRFIYFSDNGYGVVGFEIKEDGSYEKLPFVKYPRDFNAALYSHRLYLTPDEKYLYYYGARSAEFVFIDRERLEVAYVIPTINGLDGFSAAMDTKRSLIYGFPFIGKDVPVLSYENGVPRLVKWVDFSNIRGWVMQGIYDEERDFLIISTSQWLIVYDAGNLNMVKYFSVGPFPNRIFKMDTNELLISYYHSKYFQIFNIDQFRINKIEGPGGFIEAEYDPDNKIILFGELILPYVHLFNRDKSKWKTLYVGPKIRGFTKNKNGVFVASVCGVIKLDMNSISF